MGQERQKETHEKQPESLSNHSDPKVKPDSTPELSKPNGERKIFKDRDYVWGKQLRESLEMKEERDPTPLDTQEPEDASRHNSSSGKSSGINEKPGNLITGPSKKFRRPKSYIRGRKSSPENPCCPMREQQEPGLTELESSIQVCDRNKPTAPKEVWLAQEERELAALARINILNKKLNAKQSTRDYLKSLREDADDSSVFLGDPDPPAWSYETYSESERQETSLSGLRSYIRAQENHPDVAAENGQVENSLASSPQKSLVTYLDGVLPRRYPLRKCSVGLEPETTSDRYLQDEGWDHRKQRRHSCQSSRAVEEKLYRKRNNIQRRPCSEGTVRRLVVGVCSENPERKDTEKSTGQNITRLGHFDSETGVSFINKFTPLDKKKNDDEAHVVPNIVEENAHLQTNRLASQPISHATGEEPGGQEVPSQGEPEPLRSVGKLLIHPSCAVMPMLQAQEQSLAVPAVEDGYLLSGDEEEGPLQISSTYPNEETTQQSPKNRRLVVQKSKGSSARIWSSSQTLKDSKSLRRRFACDLDEGEIHDGSDDAGGEEEGYVGDGDDDYEDLIIQTELSEGSKVIVSNRNGTIADIEHGKDVSSVSTKFPMIKCSPDGREMNTLNGQMSSKGRNISQNHLKNDTSETSSLSTFQGEKANRYTGDKNMLIMRKAPSPRVSPKKVSTHRSKNFTDKGSSKPTSPVGTPVMNETAKHKWNNASSSSPPKPSAVPSAEIRRRERSGRGRNRSEERSCQERGRPQEGSGQGRSRPQEGSGQGISRPQEGSGQRRSRPQEGSGQGISRPQEGSGQGISRPQEGSGQRRSCLEEGSITTEEIKIPMCNDGKTRVLLVLRTPPKKTKDSNLGRTKGEELSPLERKKKPASPDKPSSKQSSAKPEGIKTESPKLAQPKLTPRNPTKENKSHNTYKNVGQFHKKPLSPEVGGKMQSARCLGGSSSDLTMEAAEPYLSSSERRDSGKFKLDSLVPRSCGQGREGRFVVVETDTVQDGDLRQMLEKGNGANNENNLDTEPNARGAALKGSSQGGEAVTEAQGTRNSSRKNQNRRQDESQLLNTSVTRSKPHFEKRIAKRASSDAKDVDVDRGLCSLDRSQPCNPVTHSACQFDRFRPCHHEECEDPPKRSHPDLASGVETAQTTAGHFEKTNRRTGYVYNSKKLQDKLGTHSPCVYDKYKPCLHEELLGSHDSLKDIHGVSLLQSVSKNSNKIETKAKKKETNINAIQCKFNRYTPCFHENDIKFNKALGRMASLRPEKTKAQAAASLSEEIANPCRFGPYRPCFCQEKLDALKQTQTELLNIAQETSSPQQLQTKDQQSSLKSSMQPLKYGKNMSSSETNALSSTRAFSKGSEVSDKGGKDRRKQGKYIGDQFTRAPADGPGLKTRPPTPRTHVALGAGEGGFPKADGDVNRADEGAGESSPMSLVARISRAWFSSAQAQVARLTPPPRAMVGPTLQRPDNGLGSSTKPDANMEAIINKAAAAAFGAAAKTYSPYLHQPQHASPQKHTKVSGNRLVLSGGDGNNQNTTQQPTLSQDVESSPFKREMVHEMSLAETGKTFNSYETDMSQVTEFPELTVSGWTYSQANPSHSETHYISRLGNNRTTTLTENCSGGPASTVKSHRPSRQLWNRGDSVPQDFLVLTSNIFPVNHEGGDTGETIQKPKLTEVFDSEVLSADPLPVHFSDLARAIRKDEEEGDGQMLKENHKKLYAGQAGLTLCHSPQQPRVRECISDRHHCLPRSKDSSPREFVTSGLVQDQLIHKTCIGEDVETVFQEGNIHDNIDLGFNGLWRKHGGEEVEDGSTTAYTSRGDVSADPLFEYRKRNTGRNNLISQRGQSVGCKDSVHKKLTQVRQMECGEHSSQAKASSEVRKSTRKQYGGEETYDEFEVVDKSDQSWVDGGYSQSDLSSKGREAVVVAAAELASYRSFLDTINQIARSGFSVNSPRDTAKPSPGQGLALHGPDLSRTSVHSCSSDVPSLEDSDTSDKEEQSKADNNESPTGSEGVCENSSPDEACCSFANDSKTSSSKSQYKNKYHEHEIGEKSKQIIVKHTLNEKICKKTPVYHGKEEGRNKSVGTNNERKIFWNSFNASGLQRDKGGHTKEAEDIAETQVAKFDLNYHTLSSEGQSSTQLHTLCNSLKKVSEQAFLPHIENNTGTLMPHCCDARAIGTQDAALPGEVSKRRVSEEEEGDEQSFKTDDDSAEDSSDEEDDAGSSSETQESEDIDSDEEEDVDDTEDEDGENSGDKI
ncbi:translation initiation factor IF-2 [Elysia marginata]|uniref:Translation initiation factor IF-2 n=1 Tax=Elysia marginata TaxID=1093978 RepID=A0AAV4FX07_9GAST|nr:translation initiation factor IF-2 [Elysia marginata]